MALYKGKKQRRHGHRLNSSKIYGKSSPAPKIISTVVCCAVIFALGFFIAPLLFNRVENTPAGETSSPESGDNTVSDTSSMNIVYDDASGSTSKPGEEAGSVLLLDAADFISQEALSSSVGRATESGCNTVMLNLKDVDGKVMYRSLSQSVTATGSVSHDAVDLAAVSEVIRSAGLKVGAKINVFDEYYLAWRDRAAALGIDPNTGTRWYDFVTRDITSGSPWLDPASEVARQYNLDIITELCSCGIDVLYLDGVQYPVWGKVDVYYTGNVNRTDIITGFVDSAHQISSAAGISLGIMVPVCGAVGDYHSRYPLYGLPENVYSLNAEAIIVEMRDDRVLFPPAYSSVTLSDASVTSLVGKNESAYMLLINAVKQKYSASGSNASLSVMLYSDCASLQAVNRDGYDTVLTGRPTAAPAE